MSKPHNFKPRNRKVIPLTKKGESKTSLPCFKLPLDPNWREPIIKSLRKNAPWLVDYAINLLEHPRIEKAFERIIKSAKGEVPIKYLSYIIFDCTSWYFRPSSNKHKPKWHSKKEFNRLKNNVKELISIIEDILNFADLPIIPGSSHGYLEAHVKGKFKPPEQGGDQLTDLEILNALNVVFSFFEKVAGHAFPPHRQKNIKLYRLLFNLETLFRDELNTPLYPAIADITQAVMDVSNVKDGEWTTARVTTMLKRIHKYVDTRPRWYTIPPHDWVKSKLD